MILFVFLFARIFTCSYYHYPEFYQEHGYQQQTDEYHQNSWPSQYPMYVQPSVPQMHHQMRLDQYIQPYNPPHLSHQMCYPNPGHHYQNGCYYYPAPIAPCQEESFIARDPLACYFFPDSTYKGIPDFRGSMHQHQNPIFNEFENFQPAGTHFSVPARISPNQTKSNVYRGQLTYSALKNDIFSSLKGSKLIKADPFNPPRVNVHSFLLELSTNQTALSQSAETHLNWLVEFVTTAYNSSYHENILDYFDYVKSNHLIFELKSDENMKFVIEDAILQLIQNNCCMPEVITELITLVKTDIYQYDIFGERLYNGLLDLVALPGIKLKSQEMERFLNVVEVSIQCAPIPASVVLLRPEEAANPSLGRLILHYAPLYRILMAFDDSEGPMRERNLAEALNLMIHLSDGSIYTMPNAYDNFSAFDKMFERAFIRFSNSKPGDLEVFKGRFEMAAAHLILQLTDLVLEDTIVSDLIYLMDFLILFNACRVVSEIDFADLVKIVYQPGSASHFHSMNQISIYLSIYQVTLATFRREIKDKLIEIGEISYEFILVLEALIAAVDDVDVNPAEYETWEPSREFLQLQQEIFEFDASDKKFHYLQTNFLFFAAKIFLSRQTPFQFSFFLPKYPSDGFSWSDAIDLVNFYFKTLTLLPIKSKFCKDIQRASDLSAFVDYSTIWKVYDSGTFISKKRAHAARR